MEVESERVRKETKACLERMERWFWQHVEYQMAQTGETEQEVLNTIMTPGFTGRKARQGGSNEASERMGRSGG